MQHGVIVYWRVIEANINISFPHSFIHSKMLHFAMIFRKVKITHLLQTSPNNEHGF